MNTKIQIIVDTLQELRSSCIRCDKSDSGIRNLIEKYSIIFSGANLNRISSLELCHYLNKNASPCIEITNSELNQALPDICISLNMSLEPMAALNDLNNPEPACYMITL